MRGESEASDSSYFTFALDGAPPVKAGSADRDFAAQLSPLISAPDGRVVRCPPWRIRGRVHRVLVPETRLLSVSDRLVFGTEYQPLRTRIAVLEAIQALDAKLDSRWGTVTVKPLENAVLGMPAIYEVLVFPSADLSVGPFNFSIVLSGTTKAGVVIPAIPILVTGNVVYDVRMTPPMIAFGAQLLRSNAESTVSVWSSTGKAFDVNTIECPPAVTIVRIDGEAERSSGSVSSISYKVSQRIVSAGNCSSTAQFVIRDRASSKVINVPLVLSYYGIAGN